MDKPCIIYIRWKSPDVQRKNVLTRVKMDGKIRKTEVIRMTFKELFIDSYMIVPIAVVGIPMVGIIIMLFIEIIKVTIEAKKKER